MRPGVSAAHIRREYGDEVCREIVRQFGVAVSTPSQTVAEERQRIIELARRRARLLRAGRDHEAAQSLIDFAALLERDAQGEAAE